MPHLARWLAAGHTLVRPERSSCWRLFTPDGAVLSVDPSALPAEASPADVARDEPSPAFVNAGFVNAGFAATSPPATTGAVPVLVADQLSVHGWSWQSAAVGDRPGPAGTFLGPAGSSPPARVALHYAAHPADAGFLTAGDLGPAGAQLRVSVEGRFGYLEPVTMPDSRAPGQRISHAMVRARRLACSGWPAELSALWSDNAVVGPSLVTEPAARLLAGLIGQTILTLHDSAPAGRPWGLLRRVDLIALQVSDHPILPVPEQVRLGSP